jgi:uncharacterized protein (DUF1501 family)
MHLTRRFFLKSTGAVAAYLGVCPVLPALAGDAPAPTVRKGRTLVVIFLRGGADGLNLVVPHADPAYAGLRKGIGVGAPGTPGGALDLDGFFGLNPRMSALKPLFDAGRCAALHAVGYDRNTRSHFEEQDTWETGVVGNTIHSDGWLNRHLATSAGRGPVRAVSIGDALPRIMQGRATAYAVRGLDELKLPRTAREMDPAAVSAALEHAYTAAGASVRSEATDLLARSAGATLEGVRELEALGAGPKDPPGYPKTDLARKLAQVARLIKADVGLEVAEVDLGGWDTHQNQGRGGEGQFGNLAQTLADALAAFHADLGDRSEDVLTLTLSDFGRTAFENGTGGTDHGWASCMFAVGGGVTRALAAAGTPSRRVLTRWPGLAPEQLHEKRDLLHTTDFRDVLGEVVATHLGNGQVRTVLPGHDFKPVGVVA